MAETLGSLCDKLTIVKLKQYHSTNEEQIKSLKIQEIHLIEEIDSYIAQAMSGLIPLEKLTFDSNKIHKQDESEIRNFGGELGYIFSELSDINCKLWHEQEKVYEFDKIPVDKKDEVVRRLAILNLERNRCMDEINRRIYQRCEKR